MRLEYAMYRDMPEIDPDIKITSFISRRIHSRPLPHREPAMKPRLTHKHYPRLIRQWYRPVIEELRDERQRQGIKQGDVAEAIGLSTMQINRYEVGHKLPSLLTILLWAEFLGTQLHLVKVDYSEEEYGNQGVTAAYEEEEGQPEGSGEEESEVQTEAQGQWCVQEKQAEQVQSAGKIRG